MKIVDVLSQVFPEYSKSHIRRLMNEGACWINLCQDHEVVQLAEQPERGGVVLLDELIVKIGNKKFMGIRFESKQTKA